MNSTNYKKIKLFFVIKLYLLCKFKMGGCTSRNKGENDLASKTSLNTKEIEKCTQKY